MHIGVLAVQGDFACHCRQLELLGARPAEVRLPEELDGLDGLIIPGGESTTMCMLIDRFHLRRPLLEFGKSKPVWGTCAGMIMLAKKVVDNQAGIEPLGLLDIDIVRTGYGRQVSSFEEKLPVDFGSEQVILSASFIRAPRVTRCGPEVSSLAALKGDPVLLAESRALVSSFHTELDDDTTLLEYFLTHFVGDAKTADS
ncbi:MAG: pyridoxal 5'-phosphate synthase glutaminase subunit PdxT [bacterium]